MNQLKKSTSKDILIEAIINAIPLVFFFIYSIFSKSVYVCKHVIMGTVFDKF